MLKELTHFDYQTKKLLIPKYNPAFTTTVVGKWVAVPYLCCTLGAITLGNFWLCKREFTALLYLQRTIAPYFVQPYVHCMDGQLCTNCFILRGDQSCSVSKGTIDLTVTICSKVPILLYSKALRCTFFGERKKSCSSKFVQLLLLIIG